MNRRCLEDARKKSAIGRNMTEKKIMPTEIKYLGMKKAH